MRENESATRPEDRRGAREGAPRRRGWLVVASVLGVLPAASGCSFVNGLRGMVSGKYYPSGLHRTYDLSFRKDAQGINENANGEPGVLPVAILLLGSEDYASFVDKKTIGTDGALQDWVLETPLAQPPSLFDTMKRGKLIQFYKVAPGPPEEQREELVNKDGSIEHFLVLAGFANAPNLDSQVLHLEAKDLAEDELVFDVLPREIRLRRPAP